MRRPTAVALRVAVLAGAAACTSDDPSAPSPYTVLIDLYSGQPNPEVELSASVGEQLYREVASRADDFSPGDEPAPILGFRGFVVTPDDQSLPVLRITTDTMYATHPEGIRVLADPDARYYDLILSDVGSRLASNVLDALP
ncbi:MAG: hypothetical protein IRY85_19090 [Micromonosporaceae bacterium]|nr:hypothetical protein [Micromonosporaceae bacterium]